MNTIFRARAANPFVIYAVLGALALGVLPASAKSLSPDSATQRRGAMADAPADRTTTAPVRVSMAPLREFLVRANRLKEQGKIDLSARREITIEGDRADDGTLNNPVITGPSASNASFKKLAQDFIASLNESHALKMLEEAGRVRMTFTLDGERFTARSESDMPSAARAEDKARGYRTLINFARLYKRGSDEAMVLNSTKVSSSGKQLVLNLDMTREAIGNILQKQITPN
ncbi:MAG TPA: hypothetical protein VM934_03140 [Pyrinomonadaceae bacterium]|nr:hypothetical protein [Pyrinomonadaceae bacterium]